MQSPIPHRKVISWSCRYGKINRIPSLVNRKNSFTHLITPSYPNGNTLPRGAGKYDSYTLFLSLATVVALLDGSVLPWSQSEELCSNHCLLSCSHCDVEVRC